jgi:hypothetical protein
MAVDTRNLVAQIGDMASENSIRALDMKARESIERLTADTAQDVADFLYERDSDILVTTTLPVHKAGYSRFLSNRKKEVAYHNDWGTE